VAERRGLVVPGAYDAVSARLVEQAGFPAVYMTGFGVSAARLGLPDLGFAGLAEMVDHARNLVSAVSIPLIADADTGYGNALQVRRTVQQYEMAGVAGLHLEDQATPKRCGHLAGKQVVPAEEFEGRVRAAVDARLDPDLLIIARTDAIAVTGFEDAVGRAEAAARAGADVLFVEAPRTAEQLQAVTAALGSMRPLMANMVEGGRTPLMPARDLQALGYALVIFPGAIVRAPAHAARDFYAALKRDGSTDSFRGRMFDFGALNTLIGTPQMLEEGRRYASFAPARKKGIAP
jgi:2-methylisocitrate lyase-like PEP mutase family enzyme